MGGARGGKPVACASERLTGISTTASGVTGLKGNPFLFSPLVLSAVGAAAMATECFTAVSAGMEQMTRSRGRVYLY